MDTYLALEYEHDTPLPEGFDDEFRTPHALVERFLDEYTDPGDRVFDPFAGFGTTLAVAERLGRTAYGVEYDDEMVTYARRHIPDEDDDRVRHGSVLDLDPSWVPACDCCFTSPPFMEREDDRNPFENYAGESTYADYLDDVETAFSRVQSVLAPGARVVVDVSNMKHEGRVTPLAWDVADRVSNVLHFDGEVVVTWTGGEDRDHGDGRFGYGYDHSYCLTFTKNGA
ncbi:site-specific DNA-methyltransferase [Halorubellus sp. JP-L1]|uniref:DNA methyltransferase n=1 Tax=Halorubellus sp. JP-L1 TaxID=2715753 RepID=UPI00140C28AD|nr:DNA methyltransferase [Halorubellus sp. JP-L1]NHN40121.1 site-specific DNA-methyltransferase [Halorubellus sp. JP-L1]